MLLVLLVLFVVFLVGLVSQLQSTISQNNRQLSDTTKMSTETQKKVEVLEKEKKMNIGEMEKKEGAFRSFPIQSSPPQLDSYGTCGKGEKLSKEWLQKEFGEFVKVYDKRPRRENIGGTKMVHQFAAWATIR